VSRQRKRNIQRFWFTDNTYLYNIEIATDNPLLEMFNQLVIEKKTVTLDTYYNVDRIDQMYFYKLFKFSLAKETNA
jgi:transposase-like protein